MNSNKKQNVVLADCSPEELQSFTEALNQDSNYDFAVISTISNWGRGGRFNEIKRYLTYFTIGWRTLLQRNQFQIIIGWQQFYALIFCFWSSVLRLKKSNTVVALNFTYKDKRGLLGKVYQWFMNRCVCTGYLDYIHVLSNDYADIISREFSFPRANIIVSTFGVDDLYHQYMNTSAPIAYKKGYFLAIGRSNRDYDFLIDAWKELDEKLVIISDIYKSNHHSENIEIISNVTGSAQYPWIMNCKALILPILEPGICSGDTVLLTAMSFKKLTIVTIPSTLGEMYIENGINGLLVHKEKNEFRNTIKAILHEKGCPQIEDCARRTYLEKLTRKSMGSVIAKAIYAKGVNSNG